MKFKRFLAVVLTLCMMLSISQVPVSAQEFVFETPASVSTYVQPIYSYSAQVDSEGYTAHNVSLQSDPTLSTTNYELSVNIDFTYTIANNEVTITGYTGSEVDIEIPSEIEEYPVKHIADKAFYQRFEIQSVVIPEGIVSIGDNAFSHCTKITSITLSGGVASIGNGAFDGCTALADIYYKGTKQSKDALSVGENNLPFASAVWHYVLCEQNGHNLNEITGAVCTVCEHDCATDFEYSTENNEITITKYVGTSNKVNVPVNIGGVSVVAIGDSAFFENMDVTSVTIPDSVITIGDWAFKYCEALETIDLGNGVETIGNEAFYDCMRVTELVIPDSVKGIGNSTFEYCEALTDVTFGKSLTTISNSAFVHCYNLAEITIPTNVKSIEFSAFAGCTSLEMVNLSNGVETIGDIAFYGCEKLETITIPSTTANIGSRVFGACDSLKTINVDANNNYYSSEDGVLFDKEKAELINYPNGRFDEEFELPATLVSIGDYAFADCDNLVAVTLNGIKRIGKHAFDNCISLETVELGNAVEIIEDGAFYNCITVSEIIVPDSVSAISDETFYWCESLETITLGNGISSIGDNAFIGCVALTSINIPEKVTYLGERLFEDCPNLAEIAVDENNQYYSSLEGVLYNKEKTELLFCPAGKAGEYTVPDSVTDIVDTAFMNCTNLTTVSLPEGVVTIGEYAFMNCSSLSEIQIPVSVKTVGEWAFGNCTALAKVIYLGSEKQKQDIAIADFNDALTDATWEYAITYISGDVNGDGAINNKDLGVLRRYLNDWDVTIDELASDVNRDGAVNNKDLGILRRYLNDWDVELK